MSHPHKRNRAKRSPFLRFEAKHEPLLSRWEFLKRMAWNVMGSGVLIGLSLLVGMAGYRHFEDMAWIDAFVNAAMILSGMGPMGDLKTWGGKFFAGSYALYSGLVLIVAAGVVLAPVLHRILHQFHLDADDQL